MANNSNNQNNELDANIIIDGQKVIATLAQTGEVIKDGGEIDATSVIQTETGKQKVVKVFNLGGGGGGEGIVLQANNNTTINGYQVPQLTAEQITQAYNGLVSGKQVVITDTTGLMHFAVNQADVVSGEPIISFEYFDIMELTYLTDGTIEYRTHNNQITLTQEQYDALTTYADHTDYRIIE